MRPRRRGHNLLEVMIATIIFSTAVIFLTGLWATYHHALTQNRSRMMAMAVARSELESRIALGYSNLVPLFGKTTTTPYSFQSWVRGRLLTQQMSAEFEAIDNTPHGFPRLAHLIVTVRWSEKTGGAAPTGTPHNMSIVYDAYIFDGR